MWDQLVTCNTLCWLTGICVMLLMFSRMYGLSSCAGLWRCMVVAQFREDAKLFLVFAAENSRWSVMRGCISCHPNQIRYWYFNLFLTV